VGMVILPQKLDAYVAFKTHAQRGSEEDREE
jgi:hypothetical protein